MRKICEICGAVEPSRLDKLRGVGMVFKIKTCPKCGLTYCSNCGVAKNQFDKFRGSISPLAATNLSACPNCYGK